MSTESGVAGCCSLSAKGHVFAMECTMETVSCADMSREQGLAASTNPLVRLDLSQQFALQTFEAASRFYGQPGVELPGYILLSIGLIDVLGSKMINDQGMLNIRQGSLFIDEDFGADVTVSAHEFLSAPANAVKPLFEELKFGFDL